MAHTDVLLVEDSPTLSVVYQEFLASEPYDIRIADDGKTALKEIEKSLPDVILLDLNLPDIDGMEILKIIHEKQYPIVVVVITAHGSVDIAVDAMRYGCFDFISKPFDAKRLLVTLRNAAKHNELNEIVDNYRQQYDRQEFHGFIGSSLPMQGVYRIIESASPSNATVFITGESGTGKELCAEAIHNQSPRQDKGFIALNCAAIPRDLMESEIFGHKKGAFTGAATDRNGAASLADGGTLFLDEICEMDLDLQSKILRFIQTGSFQKVGSNKVESVNIRFLCATNRDPLVEVQEGRFREDLYYRLHVIPIQLPPLRDRGIDILQIAEKFLTSYSVEENKEFKSFSTDTKQVLLNYDWPGNVRQLQNVIRNLVVLNNAKEVTADLLPPPLDNLLDSQSSNILNLKEINNSGSQAETDIIPLWLAEKKVIEYAIDKCNGNIPKAAAALEVSPSTLYRKKQGWDDIG
jgi:two-component system repressor protein LuxO